MPKTSRTPQALRKDPIIEALFEIRFEPRSDSSFQILPGMFFSSMKDDNFQVKSTPVSNIPLQAREMDATLRYAPITVLVGDTCSISMAERVLQVAVSKPYPGWRQFSDLIEKALSVFEHSSVPDEITRVSLKYSNILSVGGSEDLTPLDLKLDLGGLKRKSVGTRIRAEVEEKDHLSILDIQTHAVATQHKGRPNENVTKGLLVSVDTLSSSPLPDFWTRRSIVLEELHDAEKAVFFSLLKKDALEEMLPIWGGR